eukprot:310435_1
MCIVQREIEMAITLQSASSVGRIEDIKSRLPFHKSSSYVNQISDVQRLFDSIGSAAGEGKYGIASHDSILYTCLCMFFYVCMHLWCNLIAISIYYYDENCQK